MRTYFIRHTWGVDDKMLDELWQQKKVAIHFPDDKKGRHPEQPQDSCSLNPDDYEGAARIAMTRLKELASSGGYVCVVFPTHPSELMLGKVEPGTQMELAHGHWGSRHPECEGRAAVVKAVQLQKVKIVSRLDCTAILAGQPRGGTVNRWNRPGRAIENIVEGRRCDPALGDLDPAAQEVLCAEFLRTPEAATLGLPTLVHLLLPTGKTMKAIDILGLAADGRLIAAQVTFGTFRESAWKRDQLLEIGEPTQSHLILFCKAPEATGDATVKCISLERVFERFTATPTGKRWLSSVLGRPLGV